ncbi:unnamed protein product [Rangifer tarandus platyrhynchus]|uniref:Uncharacterized protein n=1 Tax=Rangifer tarandus platyrhynchus TaxID=3082113 RepID=A0AC60AAN5_RANTA
MRHRQPAAPGLSKPQLLHSASPLPHLPDPLPGSALCVPKEEAAGFVSAGVRGEAVKETLYPRRQSRRPRSHESLRAHRGVPGASQGLGDPAAGSPLRPCRPQASGKI